MARTLQTLLDERASALPGRDRERTVLLELVERERPLFGFVHGIAGVGKSALVRAFAGDARERGAHAVIVAAGRKVRIGGVLRRVQIERNRRATRRHSNHAGEPHRR